MGTNKQKSLKQSINNWLDQPIKSRLGQRIARASSSKWFTRIALIGVIAACGYVAVGDRVLSHLRNAREEKRIAEKTQRDYPWLTEAVDGFLRSYSRLDTQEKSPCFEISNSAFDLEAKINKDYKIFYSKEHKYGYHLLKIENTNFARIPALGGYAELCDSTAILLDDEGEVAEVREGDTFKSPETGEVPENREMVTNIILTRCKKGSKIFEYSGLGFPGNHDVICLPNQYQQTADIVLKIEKPYMAR